VRASISHAAFANDGCAISRLFYDRCGRERKLVVKGKLAVDIATALFVCGFLKIITDFE
jgi:hypothetical protein